jgi:hypothetical protein
MAPNPIERIGNRMNDGGAKRNCAFRTELFGAVSRKPGAAAAIKRVLLAAAINVDSTARTP